MSGNIINDAGISAKDAFINKPGGIGGEPFSKNDYIYDMINLIKASKCVNKYFTGKGRKVISLAYKNLWSLYQKNEINFKKDIDAAGTYLKNSEGADIQINLKYYGAFAKSTLVLFHEAIHAVLDNNKYTKAIFNKNEINGLFHEYIAWELSSKLYIELYSEGISFYPIIPYRKKRLITIKINEKEQIAFYSTLNNYLNYSIKSQNIDYLIISLNYKKYLTVKWIKENFKKWKGLINRWSTTKGAYIKILAQNPTKENAQLIFRILNSVTCGKQTKNLKKYWGDEKNIIRTLNYFSNDIDLYIINRIEKQFSICISFLSELNKKNKCINKNHLRRKTIKGILGASKRKKAFN